MTTTTSPVENPDPNARPANARYNFIILTVDGLTFWLGMSYFSPTTILPLFVSHLSTSNVLAGAVPAIVTIAWAIPQLVGASIAGGLSSRKNYIVKTALLGRVPLLLMIAFIWAYAIEYPTLTLGVFFVGFGLFRALSGLNTPIYYDLVGSTIHPRDRSRFIGLNQFLGGGIGALALVAGRSLLDTYPFPMGFVICFGIGITISTLAIGWIASVREPAIVATTSNNRAHVLTEARRVIRADHRFRDYLIARCVVVLAGMASAFYAIQATRELGATDGDVAIYSAILLASQTTSMMVWGACANYVTLVRVLWVGTAIGGLGSLLALVAPTAGALSFVFLMTGISLGAVVVTDVALPLEFAENANEDRALYVAIANTVLSPVNLIAPLIGGAIADSAGFGATYVGACAFAVVAVAVVARTRLTSLVTATTNMAR